VAAPSAYSNDLTLDDRPHRRFNPLLDEWVLVSPQRLARPWLGRTEPAASETRPVYDPDCYLCPGNVRAGEARNPQYTGTFVFDNDFPALVPPGTSLKARTTPDETSLKARAASDSTGVWHDPSGSSPLLVARPEPGICRVVCFSPRHDASLPCLSISELRAVVDVWVDQYVSLSAEPWISHVQIFENRGASMGASNPHPHGQIWAGASLPDLPAREERRLDAYRSARGSCLLCDYLAEERGRDERIVCANDTFTALVPFWAVWPFETLVLPSRHVTGLDELTAEERNGLADLLKRVTARYDTLFAAPCPYSMGFHQRPTRRDAHPEWHLHAHFFPPVLRSAAVHKFMVGYELLATPQRDLTPERAAAILKEAS
jgi:UDPglucose--hexose-1-phosphate uridylyltransferase